MSTYTGKPIIYVDGAELDPSVILYDVEFTLGRNSIMEQPQAGYGRIELWSSVDTVLPIHLGASILINAQWAEGSGTSTDVATGVVSDINITIDQYGDIGSIAIYRITFVGALAQLNRAIVGEAGFAKEYDIDRMTNILEDAFSSRWNNFSTTQTWANMPNNVVWADLSALGAEVVIGGNPVYELEAYAGGATNALTLAQECATSSRGILAEDRSGKLFFLSYDFRSGVPADVIDPDWLDWSSLAIDAQWSEIVNDLTITYKNNQTVNARDDLSVITYGEMKQTLNTVLENQTDAQNQANDYIAQRAYARTYPTTFVIDLANPILTNAQRGTLYAFDLMTRISITGLPTLFGTNFDGFIESLSWRFTKGHAVITMTCSTMSESYTSQIWLQISNAITWATYTPTTETWGDL